MTAETDLLPIPQLAANGDIPAMHEWCRANLAERDAEVEALRAEVERLREVSQQVARMAGANNLAAVEAEARAERLAGALREIADWKLPETGETWPSGGAVSYEAAVGSRGVQDYIRAKARAALDQETTNG